MTEVYYPALPAPEVTFLTDDSTVTAGDSHSLTCRMTHIPHLTVSPTVKLIGPGGNVLATGTSYTVTHTLNPVMTSHAGHYNCSASVVILSVRVGVSGQTNAILYVQSMWLTL